MQDRFQEFMDAPTVEYMTKLRVGDPLDLIALGDAYYAKSQQHRRRKEHEEADRFLLAAMTMVAVWVKLRHPDAPGMPERLPAPPRPPNGWKGHRKRVKFAMGYGLEPAEIVSIDDLRAARAA